LAGIPVGWKILVSPIISVVIVNYKSSELLRACLESIRKGSSNSIETWVVDNASEEDLGKLQREFPEVHWIFNAQNVGFGKAVNQALRIAPGKYFLILNPDTRLDDGAAQKMAEFLDSHPEVGMVGARVLGVDGKHDPASHRGIPTPATAFYRLSGLSRLFPSHPVFGQYNLRALNPDTGAYVEAVSGACMMARREMLDQIGLFDETFFLFGEDLDLCYRAGQGGWKVYYLPEAKVIHVKGGSRRRNRMRSYYEFYHAMGIFHRKHFAASCGPLLNSLIRIAIWGHALAAFPGNLIRSIRG
jgi:GT2 family glycosyltransferase